MAMETFPFLEIFMPFVGIGMVVMCCVPLCRLCQSYRATGSERVDSPNIYIIPFPAEDRTHSPPRYSTTVITAPPLPPPPPPYAEVEMKPELFPHPDSPPPYVEVELPFPSTNPPPPPPTTARSLST